MAAGLTIKPENFRTFKEKIKEYAERNVFIPEDTGETFYDLEIDANDVPAYLKEVRKYAPFGEANPNPVFIIKNFVPVREINGNPYKELSCDGVKMSAENVTAVGFGMLPDFIGKTFSNISLSGTLSENYFRGSITPQISFLDYNLEP